MYSASTIENKFSFTKLHLLFLLLIVRAFFSLWILSVSPMGLSPDEAQYWTWSQALDWGYYSKPPAIAWQIWATTLALGHTELGVRFGAVILNFFLPLVVYSMARFAELSPRVAFWSSAVCAFSPIGIFLSFMATTDVGLLLFFSLAVATVVKGISENETPNYLLVGTWLLIAALYKWPAYLFWPITLGVSLFVPLLRSRDLVWGILISLIALVPSIYWNYMNEWATFKHISSTIQGVNRPNSWDFLGAQLGFFNPIFWFLFFYGLPFLKQKALKYIALFPLVIFVYFGVGFFKHLQPNWALYLLPPACVIVAWTALAKLRLGPLWLHLGVWTSIALSLFALLIPVFQSGAEVTFAPIPYKMNPFRQTLGWDQLDGVLLKAGYNPDNHFLFAHSYQNASLLSFYGKNQARAYFFNLEGRRKNQFSFWPGLEDKRGEDGYFLIMENHGLEAESWYKKHYAEILAPFFSVIEYKGTYPLFKAYGVPVKCAYVFSCKDFLGKFPKERGLY
jgi:4-amino-4-deoxy-L-arabinose transferase-like glycosyltransferase